MSYIPSDIITNIISYHINTYFYKNYAIFCSSQSNKLHQYFMQAFWFVDNGFSSKFISVMIGVKKFDSVFLKNYFIHDETIFEFLHCFEQILIARKLNIKQNEWLWDYSYMIYSEFHSFFFDLFYQINYTSRRIQENFTLLKFQTYCHSFYFW